MAQYQDGVDRKDWSDAVAAQIKLYDAFCGLPFYNRYFFEKENTLAMLVAYAGEENRVDALRILLREMRTTKQYSNALEDIRFKSATHGSLTSGCPCERRQSGRGLAC